MFGYVTVCEPELKVKDLKKYKAFPTFMADYLEGEHREIVHIVTDERVG